MIVAMARMVVPVAQQQVHHRQVQPGVQQGQAGAAANASSRPKAPSAEQEDTTGVSYVDHDGRMVTHRSRRGRSRHCGDDD